MPSMEDETQLDTTCQDAEESLDRIKRHQVGKIAAFSSFLLRGRGDFESLLQVPCTFLEGLCRFRVYFRRSEADFRELQNVVLPGRGRRFFGKDNRNTSEKMNATTNDDIQKRYLVTISGEHIRTVSR